MRRFLAISVLLHLGFLGLWLGRGGCTPREDPPSREALAVRLVTLEAPPDPGAAETKPPRPPELPPEIPPPPVTSPPPPKPTVKTEPPAPAPIAEPAPTESVPTETGPSTPTVAQAPPPPPAPLGAAPVGIAEAPAPAPSEAELREIRSRIERALRYPRMARRRGWEGTAMVRFHVENGVATGVELLQATGREVLDREAVEVLGRAGPFPPVPGALEIPVRFELR